MEIQLLPEFGWLVNNTPMYGPGSVFQGFIKAKFSKDQLAKSSRLRIVFHATESTYHSGYHHPVYKNQLFGSQKILWKRKDNTGQIPFKHDTNTSIPFIIQLPMVQFPPQASIISDGKEMSYFCEYMVSVYLEDADDKPILMHHKPVVYMPFVETNLSKKPICISSQQQLPSSSYTAVKNQNQPSIELRLPSLEFGSDDTIPITLLLRHLSIKTNYTIQAKLYQIQTWYENDQPTKKERKFRHLVCQITKKSISDNHDSTSTVHTDLALPINTLPTFTYGPVFSVNYMMEVNVKQTGLWPRQFEIKDVPIRLGTLGYGSRVPETIEVYSTFDSVFKSQNHDSQTDRRTLPVPRFVEAIEYEEALPVYVSERPPPYSPTAHSAHENCAV